MSAKKRYRKASRAHRNATARAVKMAIRRASATGASLKKRLLAEEKKLRAVASRLGRHATAAGSQL
jgi:hypothetical protein